MRVPPSKASDSANVSSSSSQANHLLTAEFIGSLVAAALAPQGVLCICSDNLWYAQMLCRIIGSSRECATNFVSLQQADTKLKVQEEVEGITLFLGVPGQNCGVPDATGWRQATLTGCSSRGCQTMRQPSRGTHCVCGGFEISERIGDYCAINNTSRRQGMRSGT